ncbi:MAG: GNAT family N-acetyltransferase [Butyrivibrio sp.]|nr:GNAT family N-acetyltransferase [Acetatifactor muris]MCM1559827.1 GNAT family N-acetyltransferase [Butyrivibrio sp.]
MGYLKRIEVNAAELKGTLYVTDSPKEAERLRDAGEAVLIWFHDGNKDCDFSGYTFGVEDPEQLEEDYIERVYRRLKGLPWKILETERCLIRETTPEDVEDFFRIYSDPAITEFMEGLYPDKEQEKEYIREYIKQIYTFYEFGVWTVVEKSSGSVIGRAGFSYRQGYDEPELGFIIGVPWQRRGYGEEVCRAILDYGRNKLGFQEVNALVETENEASLKLCDKLGFRAVQELYLGEKDFFLLKYTV